MANHLLTDTVLRRQLALAETTGVVPQVDLLNRCLSQLSLVVRFSVGHSSLGGRITKIVSMATEEQVNRSDAQWIVAVMTTLRAFWDRTVGKLVGDTMGEHDSIRAYIDHTVAFVLHRPGPYPAITRLVDLFPEALSKRPHIVILPLVQLEVQHGRNS